MRSCWKVGLTATVVVVQRWAGSRVTLILSLTGKIRVSSLFPQYLITAMLVGVCAVTITTQFCDSLAITIDQWTFPANFKWRRKHPESEGSKKGKRGLGLEARKERDARLWMRNWNWNERAIAGRKRCYIAWKRKPKQSQCMNY